MALDSDYNARSLIEAWDGTRWHIAATPDVKGRRDMLFSASATSNTDVWAVGQRQDLDGRFHTLVEHFNGTRWAVLPAADPGSAGNSLYAVTALGPGDVWAVGQRNDRWTVTAAPAPAGAAAYLDAIAGDGHNLWAVGATDDATHGSRPLAAHYTSRTWQTSLLPVGSTFTTLNGVAVTNHRPWTSGTYYNPATDRQHTLIARLTGSGWQAIHAPSPGTGDAVLGGLTTTGGQLWAGGYDKDSTGREPLIEHATG